MRELDLLDGLEDILSGPSPSTLTWVGDDASVVETDRGVAVTSVDQTVMGVHADERFFDHSAFGARAVLGALSDLAAMGTRPAEIHLALMLPPGTTKDEAADVIRGADRAAVEHGARIAGGDITSGPVLSAAVTVTGRAPSAESVVTRSGAMPGDLVGVTGSLGGSGAGLLVLRGADGPKALCERHLRPTPRLAEGLALAEAGVHAMIDLSDGLATDGRHIGRAGGVTLEVVGADLPLGEGVATVADAIGVEPATFAATAGEDFELLVCVPPDRAEAAAEAVAPTPLTWIGRVTAGPPGCTIDGRDDLAGWEHRFEGPSDQPVPPSEPGPA